MAQKELDMTELLEEIIASLPNEVSEYTVRNHPDTRSGKRVAGGKPGKRICVWIRSTLHEKVNVHAKAKGLSMNRFLLEAIRNYRLRQRATDRLSQSQEESRQRRGIACDASLIQREGSNVGTSSCMSFVTNGP